MDIEKIINGITFAAVIRTVLGMLGNNIYLSIFCFQVFAFWASKFPKRGSYGEVPWYYPKEDCQKPKFGKVLFFYGKPDIGVPKEEIWNTWGQIIWSVCYIVFSYSYLLSTKTNGDTVLEFFFLLGIGGCVVIGLFFNIVIRIKCFLNRYKKFTLHNFIYCFSWNSQKIPPIIEYGECIVLNRKIGKKYSSVTIEMIKEKSIYNDVILESKYIDEKYQIYQMFEICKVRYIVPKQLVREMKENGGEYFVNKDGEQVWP